MATIYDFVDGFLEAALVMSQGDPEPRPEAWTVDNIDENSMKQIVEECERFQDENCVAIARQLAAPTSPDGWSSAGADFFLTRNGHGAGFWDGDWGEDGDALTEAAKSFGELDLYVGDDGVLYCYPPPKES